MTEQPGSSRRDFLTGRFIQRELRKVGDQIADAVVDAGEQERQVPVGQETIRLETTAMACSWGVFMNPGPPRQVMVASDALDLVHGVEDLLTVYRDDSDVARINEQAADGPVEVSEDLFQFLLDNESLWKLTEGAFDPATGALVQLWREARRAGTIPDEEAVEQVLQHSGMRYVELDREQRTVFFRKQGLLFDFGGSGKGHAIDRCAEHLRGEDVLAFLIHGGHSSLWAQGDHAGLGGWPVGIKNPLFTQKRYATVVLCNEGMSTSGSNVQYFRHEGRRFGHILDPRTGWPAESLLSVSVIAPTAMEADVLSTAFYVMGLDNALRYCDDHNEIGAILIPTPTDGRTLRPIVRNLAEDRLFFEEN